MLPPAVPAPYDASIVPRIPMLPAPTVTKQPFKEPQPSHQQPQPPLPPPQKLPTYLCGFGSYIGMCYLRGGDSPITSQRLYEKHDFRCQHCGRFVSNGYSYGYVVNTYKQDEKRHWVFRYDDFCLPTEPTAYAKMFPAKSMWREFAHLQYALLILAYGYKGLPQDLPQAPSRVDLPIFVPNHNNNTPNNNAPNHNHNWSYATHVASFGIPGLQRPDPKMHVFHLEPSVLLLQHQRPSQALQTPIEQWVQMMGDKVLFSKHYKDAEKERQICSDRLRRDLMPPPVSPLAVPIGLVSIGGGGVGRSIVTTSKQEKEKKR